MADRIGVISKGEIILVEEKAELMRKLGRKQLTLHLEKTLARIPTALSSYSLELKSGGTDSIYNYDQKADRARLTALLPDLAAAGVTFTDLQTTQRSRADISATLA